MHAGWRFVELGFTVENLFDVRNRAAEFHYASGFDTAGGPASMREVRHFAAGEPRSFQVTLTLHSDVKWLTDAGE